MNRHLLCLATVLAVLLTRAAGAETLTLTECLKLAAAGNYTLAVASRDKRIAAESVTQSKSGFLPRVDVQGGYTLQLEAQAVEAVQGRYLQTQDANYGFFSVSATQTIYDFGRTSSRVNRSTLLQEAVEKDYTAKEKEVFLQVVEAYYGILEAGKLVQAADEEVTQREDHLRIARNLFEQGVVTRNDLLQAEVKLADSRQKRLSAVNRRENRWLSLDYLIGQPLSYRAELEEAVVPAAVSTGPGSEERALANRPEIVSLQRIVAAGEAEVQEARTGYYPELYAKAGIDYVENSMVREQAIYAATVGLRVNLFDGFATTARQRQAVENLAKSRGNLRMVQEQIRLELQTAGNDARVAAERIKTMETAITQGEENLRINRDRYREQVGTATEVLDAQTLLTQIRTDYYRAVFDHQVATARVRKALGEL